MRGYIQKQNEKPKPPYQCFQYYIKAFKRWLSPQPRHSKFEMDWCTRLDPKPWSHWNSLTSLLYKLLLDPQGPVIYANSSKEHSLTSYNQYLIGSGVPSSVPAKIPLYIHHHSLITLTGWLYLFALCASSGQRAYDSLSLIMSHTF